MKAIVQHKYGGPDRLHIEDVAIPTPTNDEVLVKVHASSINSGDWRMMRGEPFLVRLDIGLRAPTDKIPGSDIAGYVEAVGSNVTQFKVGDAVMGDLSFYKRGAFAEYVCTTEDMIILIPNGLNFEQAAAVPVASVTALQGLRSKGSIQPGDKVLVNGAASGVGSYAIQIAKVMGAEVTGVCSTPKMKTVHAIGADHVIDYTQEDFTRNGEQYDLILDIAAYRTAKDFLGSLTPTGNYVVVGGSMRRLFASMGSFNKQISAMGPVKRNLEDMAYVAQLVAAGQVTPAIDKCYPLEEVPAAIDYVESRQVQGKVVINIVSPKTPS